MRKGFKEALEIMLTSEARGESFFNRNSDNSYTVHVQMLRPDPEPWTAARKLEEELSFCLASGVRIDKQSSTLVLKTRPFTELE